MVDLEKVNRDVTDLMKRVYGDRLAAIVLFGSYARGDFHEESDVDYLVVLTDDEVSTSREISKLSSYLNAVFLNEGIRISAKPVATHKIKSSLPLYTEVRREGKSVYERPLSQVY